MMTTDAHAQTNTERLMTTVDNTNSILAALQSLADAVADGFASVLAAIGMVQTGVDNMSGHLEHLESDVAGISSDVASVDSSVAAVSSDVASIADDVADVSSSLQSVQNDVAGLSAGLAGSTAAFSSISEQVSANQVAINDLSAKLDMISEAVGAVQETVEMDPADAAEPITELVAGSSEAEITVADFADGISKHPTTNIYTSSNSFSCDGDVFVDMVTLTNPDPVLTTADISTAPAPVSTVVVHGQTLYAAAFDPGSGTLVQLHKAADLDNLFLPAGSTLDIKGSTDQSTTVAGASAAVDGVQITATEGSGELYLSLQQYVETEKRKDPIPGTATTSGNVTKAELGEETLYNLKVDWSAPSSDTTCSIDSVSGTAVGLDRTGTVLVGLSITDSEAPLPAMVGERTVECNLSTAEITGASIRVGGSPTLNAFNTITLSAGGESAEIKFDSANNFDEDTSKNMPFRFTGSDLTVGGESVNNLLVELEYATVEGNSCSLSE